MANQIRRHSLLQSLLFLLFILAVSAPSIAETAPTPARSPANADGHWPSFRGERAQGIAEGHATPVHWNVEENQNLLWRTAIPGLGHSSPVVWGNQICLTTAISGQAEPELRVGLYGDIAPVEDETSHRFEVLCLDKTSGKILWRQVAHEGVPQIKRHPKATHANSTPATDGKTLVASFGSEGLYAYDMQGKLRWKKDLGKLDSAFYMVPTAQWGFASSPILHDGKIIVQADVLQNSFLAAFDALDGRELWRRERKDVPTLSSPTIYETGDKTGVAVNGMQHMGGYDLETGEEIWTLSKGGDIPVPTPVVAGDHIFLTNSHGFLSPIYAVRKDARGKITLEEDATSNEGITWSTKRGGAYMPTPLVYGEHLYLSRDNGSLTCYDAESGEKKYEVRLAKGRIGFTASGVAADGKLYYVSEMGDVHVIQTGPTFERLAENPLGEVTLATPAISEGVLFFRTKGHLVAIAEKGEGMLPAPPAEPQAPTPAEPAEPGTQADTAEGES